MIEAGGGDDKLSYPRSGQSEKHGAPPFPFP